jgi:signal peptidase I
MIAAACGLAVVVLVAVGVLRARLVRVTVHGDSMAPTLHHGDRVLVRRTRLDALRRGDLVVFRRPREPTPSWMVKRVLAAPGDPLPRTEMPNLWSYREAVVPADRLVVVGDNSSVSYDSRQFGLVHGGTVLGVVIRGAAPASTRSSSRLPPATG